MVSAKAPVVANRDWRFLLRAFVAANPKMQSLSSKLLTGCLAPVASLAWWLETSHPELLDQEALTVVLPGAGALESLDEGRWFSFLPWMLGRPQLATTVILVGNELWRDRNTEQMGASLRKGNPSPANSQIAQLPKAQLFDGTLGQWRAAGEVHADAVLMFSPGFSTHYKTWLTKDELLPVLQSGVPVGVFCYSRMDALEDQAYLRLAGLQVKARELPKNPWFLNHEMASFIGAFGAEAWEFEEVVIPDVLDLTNAGLKDFDDLQQYARPDFEELGADQALARLGARWAVSNQEKPGEEDAIIILPREHGILASTRQVGEFDDIGFTPLRPSLIVPEALLAEHPGDEDIIQRMLWALRFHRDWLAPKLEAHTGFDFPDELSQQLKELLKGAGLDENMTNSDLMRAIRVQGGVHGPTHPHWFDMLESLGWAPTEYEDDPERLEPAFWVPSKRLGTLVPVICEAYMFFPDDDEDDLAFEAMEVVEDEYPEGALLLFKSLPFKTVAGHDYSFGGMLLWNGEWRPFALCAAMKTVDAVFEQVASGFSFGKGDPRYADDKQFVATPFNRMCNGHDPNKPGKMGGLRSARGWITQMPG